MPQLLFHAGSACRPRGWREAGDLRQNLGARGLWRRTLRPRPDALYTLDQIHCLSRGSGKIFDSWFMLPGGPPGFWIDSSPADRLWRRPDAGVSSR